VGMGYKIRAWLGRFMYGRYGPDALNRALSICAMILCVVSMFVRWPALSGLVMALMAVTIVRALSRNRERRMAENRAYLRLQGKATQAIGIARTRFSQRGTHKYYRCPACKQTVRVPKGKGRIVIFCPKCQAQFERKT